ncbi:putative reverse transcriptase domain-containing protein [Tanacetum coccineum]|uniref:Reverse transcriptase domain-containing protein n=1 Tax=Tanacetum coccineum TaxID=301880 RepID=A0ABQ5C0V7_9ASTR
MDWLSYHRAIIVCYEKIVRIPLLNGEILEIQGERPGKDPRSLSCIKDDEKKLDDIRIVRDFPEDVEKKLDDIRIIRDFPEVFLDDLTGLPPVREIEFRIDLIPGALPVVKSPCRLAPSEMLELELNKLIIKNRYHLPRIDDLFDQLQGLAGYYRRFIENFSKIAKPLTLLTQKNKTYVWGDKQEEAFHILKEKLCNAPVLALSNGPNDFVVYCDASNQGFGCVLMQRGKQRRWIELLSDYECEIKYHPGKANVVADALSRKERLKPRRVRAMSMTIQSGLKAKILEAQSEASKDFKAPTEWYPVHPDADKMYYVLRYLYWWPGIKRDIVDYVIVDRLTKSAHFLPIREDYKMEKLARIYINEIIARHGVPVSIISDRDSRFASHLWQALQKALGTRLDMSTTYHPQTDGQRVVRFGKKGKLAPWYVGPFKIVECARPVAYRLKLPQELSCIQDTFHVLNLKKCLAESDIQVPLEEIEIDENLRFVEEPIEIVARDLKKINRKRIPLVKVCWNSRQGAEYTWEREDQFKTKYPYLFASTSSAIAS